MADMDRNVANDGRFERHIVDATAQARQAALEAKKYAGIAVNAAEAATGAGTSWIARTDRGNVFNGCNVFAGNAAVNGSLSAGAGVFVGTCESSVAGKLRSSGDGHLYWGGDRVGDVASGNDNVFTGHNTFTSYTIFDHGISVYGDGISLSDRQYKADCSLLYSYGDDLYWGETKLNGGDAGTGYARLCGCNVFAGQNVFSRSLLLDSCGSYRTCLANRSGYLHWNGTKVWTEYDVGSAGAYATLDGDNVFTSANNRMRGLDIGTKDTYAKRLRITGNSISVISGENTVLGSTTLEKFAAFLNTL